MATSEPRSLVVIEDIDPSWISRRLKSYGARRDQTLRMLTDVQAAHTGAVSRRIKTWASPFPHPTSNTEGTALIQAIDRMGVVAL